MSLIAGVDLGGTQLRVALVNEGDYSGQIVHYYSTQSPIRSSTESGDQSKVLASIEDAIVTCISQSSRKDNISGVGVAVPDPVSSDGILVSPTLFRGWDGYQITNHLQKQLQRKFTSHLKVIVGNDANLAAIAEYRYRTNVNKSRSKNFVYLTVSTGIGAGLIINDHLYTGTNGYAGEYGHIIIEASSPSVCPGCHQNGCFEVLASGSAIAREGAKIVDKLSPKLREIATHNKHSETELTLSDFVSNDGIVVTAQDVVWAAHEGDIRCQNILNSVSKYLAIGITLILHSINPDHIIVGGGVSQEDTFIWNPAIIEIHRLGIKATLDVCRIERPILDKHVTALGAAFSVMGGL